MEYVVGREIPPPRRLHFFSDSPAMVTDNAIGERGDVVDVSLSENRTSKFVAARSVIQRSFVTTSGRLDEHIPSWRAWRAR